MILQIPITEAEHLIEAKTGRRISVFVIDNNTFKVGHELKVKTFLAEITKNISIDIKIEKMIDNSLYLLYSSGGLVTDMALNGILSAFPAFSSKNVVRFVERNRLVVNLTEIEEARKFLKNIRINNISFANENVIVDFNVRN